MAISVDLLEESFAKVKPRAVEFSACFYQHLFENAPDVKPMFDDVSLELQEKKLVASLALIVENLHNPEALSNALQGLGAHHTTKGTLPEHYPLIGKALLQAFGDYLGEDWTPEVAQAWIEAYQVITTLMLQGADRAAEFLHGELTFYEWLDLYGESSSSLRNLVSSTTHFKYGVH